MLGNLQTFKTWDKSLSSKSVPVVITSYHRPTTFIRCVKSVLKATHHPIYVIDNSEGQLRSELAWAEENGIQVFVNPKNIGKPSSIRKFWNKIPQHQWFITMDPDVIIPENGIDALLNKANELCENGYPIGLSVPAIEQKGRIWQRQLETKNLVMHNWTEMRRLQENIYLNSTIAGCLMVVNTLLYNHLKGFPGTRLYNDDDGWLCNQSIKSGLMNIIDSRIIIEHDLTEETPDYREWKDRNSKQQIDPQGLWDQ